MYGLALATLSVSFVSARRRPVRDNLLGVPSGCVSKFASPRLVKALVILV